MQLLLSLKNALKGASLFSRLDESWGTTIFVPAPLYRHYNNELRSYHYPSYNNLELFPEAMDMDPDQRTGK